MDRKYDHASAKRVARSLLRFKSAFRRNARQASWFYKRGKLWFTSSAWGGWCFAALLLGGVVGGAALYLDSIPESAETLKYLQLYVVIVIGLGSLYIAGKTFWEKQGSVFFVEYQTAIDSNVAALTISPLTEEETIGNPVNSIMPYVKRIYIRNEKNKHEAIKKILLQLPNNQIIILKKFEKANALLMKPYEDKVVELNAVTAYLKQYDILKKNKDITKYNKVYIFKNKNLLDKGEIIIKTAQGQSYIKSNKKHALLHNERNFLHPIRYFWGDSIGKKGLVFDLNIFHCSEIIMRKCFVNDDFHDQLIVHLNRYPHAASKFNKREGELIIQVTLDKKKEVTLSYSFLLDEKKYVFPVQQYLQEEFVKAYNEYKFSYFKLKNFTEEKNLSIDIINNVIASINFTIEISNFCHGWAIKKWGAGNSSIYKRTRSESNLLAFGIIKEIKIIKDEKP